MDKYKRLASNTIILAIGQFGSKLLVYVMMYFYTDTLGTAGYGTVGNIVDASSLLMGIVSLSIGESVIRFGLDKAYDKTQVFSIGFLTTLTGLLIFLPFVPLIGAVDFLSRYSVLIYIYVFTGTVKNTCALFVRSTGLVRLFALDGIFTTLINVLFNFLFLMAFKMGVTGYVLSVVLADLCSVSFLFISANLKSKLRIFGLDKKLRREMYRFCIPMIPTTVMWWVTNVSDGFFVTAIMGADATGIYKAAYKLPNIIALLSGIFSQAWNMSAVTEKNSGTIVKFYTDVFSFFQSLIYMSGAGILLLIRPALDIMTSGDSFKTAYKYSPFLVLAVIFTCFSTFMGSIYVASKKSTRSMVTVSVGAILNLILNALLIPKIGLQGAALSTFISYVAVFSVRVADTRKIIKINLYPEKMAVNLIFLLIMGLIIIFIKNSGEYYFLLSLIFLIIFSLNYRVLLKFILRKKHGLNP